MLTEGDFISPKEALRIVTFSKSKLYRLLKNDVIPSSKPGGNWSVDRAGLARYLENNRHERRPQTAAEILGEMRR